MIVKEEIDAKADELGVRLYGWDLRGGGVGT